MPATTPPKDPRTRPDAAELLPTKLLIMRPDQPHETREVELPRDPGYDRLRALLDPLLDGGNLEHVSVLADFAGGLNFKPADMFVDDDGHSKGLPRNETATVIYRRNWLLRHPDVDPESIPFIVGPAVLFHRRVWF